MRTRYAMISVLMAVVMGLPLGPLQAQEKKPVTEDQLIEELLKILPLENDPLLDVRRRPDLILAFLKQLRHFMLKPGDFRNREGGMAQASKVTEKGGNVTAGKGGATLVYQIPIVAPGPYKLEGKRKGKAQYWTVQGEPTYFVAGAKRWEPVTVEGVARKAGIKRFTISIPEGGSFGPMKMTSTAGRPLLPSEGIGGERVLNHRRLLALIARILGKLGRLKPKKDAKWKGIAPKRKHPDFAISQALYALRLLRSGVFQFQLKDGASLEGALIDGQELGMRIHGAPAPEGEQGGQKVFLSLTEGEHVLEVPRGTRLDSELEMIEMEEGGGAYQELLKDLGFTAENLEAAVTGIQLEVTMDTLRELLEPKQKQKDTVEVFLPKQKREPDKYLTEDWDYQFPEARAPVSPVLPSGE